MENEVWKDIPEFEGLYQVSNLGMVKSVRWYYVNSHNKNKTPYQENKILKLTLTKPGYLRVELNATGKAKKYPVHRLVALAFIPNPENKDIVNHINGVKNDNSVENLEWNTSSENITHAFETKLFVPRQGETHAHAKLSEKQVREIKEKFENGEFKNQTKVAKLYNVSHQTINNIMNGKVWRSV